MFSNKINKIKYLLNIFGTINVVGYPVHPCSVHLAGGLDNNCQVNFLDYVVFADAWASQSPTADINGDSNVDLLDVTQLATDWLKSGY